MSTILVVLRVVHLLQLTFRERDLYEVYTLERVSPLSTGYVLDYISRRWWGVGK